MPGACYPWRKTTKSKPTKVCYVFSTKTDADLHVLTLKRFRQNSDYRTIKYKLYALRKMHTHMGTDAVHFILGYERQANAKKKI